MTDLMIFAAIVTHTATYHFSQVLRNTAFYAGGYNVFTQAPIVARGKPSLRYGHAVSVKLADGLRYVLLASLTRSVNQDQQQAEERRLKLVDALNAGTQILIDDEDVFVIDEKAKIYGVLKYTVVTPAPVVTAEEPIVADNFDLDAVNRAVKKGFVIKKGSWYVYQDHFGTIKAQGAANFAAALKKQNIVLF